MSRAGSGRGGRAVLASALIIAGGQGTRFWPLSRQSRPKPLFSVDGKKSLLARAVSRLRPLIPRERTFVLVSAPQAALFRRALRGLVPARNLIVEPEGRGTAVAIAYGASVIKRRLGDGVIAVIPADHHIAPDSGFRRTLGEATRLAASEGALVVIGVTPTRPETGYGYQKIGAGVGKGFRVERFVEKPAPALARRMVRSGKYLWNAGMFVMSVATLATELEKHCPPLAKAAERLAALDGHGLLRAYRRLKLDSFDREVVERSANVLGVRARFGWHDVGSYNGLWEAAGGRSGNVLRGNVMAFESEGVLAHSDSRLMVLFGMRDVVAVDTGDALLIADRSRSQGIRRITEELKRRRMHRYL